VPALAALAIAAAFVGALLIRAEGDPSLLVHAGPPWTDPAGARGSLTVQEADEAFDGQFFYRIGTAPWSEAETENGVTFDLPALRNARWGYGALAYVASFGDPDLVPWSLIAVNLAAAGAVGAIGGALAQRAGRHALWGLMLFGWPGFAYSLSLDTSELVASAFVLGGMLALARAGPPRRWVGAAACFSAAVAVRDTTLVVPLGVAAAGAWTLRPHGQHQWSRRWARGRPWLLAGAVPVTFFIVWQLLQRARFGELPVTSSGDNNLSGPLVGLAELVREILPPGGGDEAFRLLSLVGLVVLLATAAWLQLRSSERRLDALSAPWLAAVTVVVLLNAYLWSGATAFMRASTEAGLLSILVVLRSGRPRVQVACATGLAGLWALTAVAQLAKLG
jgi:hypothetical protein